MYIEYELLNIHSWVYMDMYIYFILRIQCVHIYIYSTYLHICIANKTKYVIFLNKFDKKHYVAVGSYGNKSTQIH